MVTTRAQAAARQRRAAEILAGARRRVAVVNAFRRSSSSVPRPMFEDTGVGHSSSGAPHSMSPYHAERMAAARLAGAARRAARARSVQIPVRQPPVVRRSPQYPSNAALKIAAGATAAAATGYAVKRIHDQIKKGRANIREEHARLGKFHCSI